MNAMNLIPSPLTTCISLEPFMTPLTPGIIEVKPHSLAPQGPSWDYSPHVSPLVWMMTVWFPPPTHMVAVLFDHMAWFLLGCMPAAFSSPSTQPLLNTADFIQDPLLIPAPGPQSLSLPPVGLLSTAIAFTYGIIMIWRHV